MNITQVVDNVLIAVGDHDPYVYGGISLYTGADCSGVIYEALLLAGVNGELVPRTSQAQFYAWEEAPGPGYGIAVFFDVPSDGGEQPGHVGLCLTDSTMAEEPHTGADAEIVQIPNIPGVESVMGYRYLPVDYSVAPTPAPAPAPAGPPIPDLPPYFMEMLSMNCLDPESNGTWIIDPSDGHVETQFGAPYLGGMNESKNQPDADRDNWKQVGYIAGICPWKSNVTGEWGFGVIVHHNDVLPGGAWYSTYTFERNGSNV